jgi:hypothetical protein
MAKIQNFVIHFTRTTGATTLASAGIALDVAAATGWDLIDDRQTAARALRQGWIDRACFVNSPWAFCDFRDDAVKLAALAKRRIWAQNDYAISIPAPLRKAGEFVLWTTVPDQPGLVQYVNFNALTYRLQPPLNMNSAVAFHRNTVFYYGAYRKDREEDFRRYFSPPTDYPMVISCTSRAAGSFRALAPEARLMIPCRSVMSEARHYGATIYIEDATSHRRYCSPANRFYECLSAGIAIAFDIKTVGTMERAGFDVRRFVVEDAAGMARFLRTAPDAGGEQRAAWATGRNYRREVLDTIKGLAQC